MRNSKDALKIRKPNWQIYGYKPANDEAHAKRRSKEAKAKGQEVLDGELDTAVRYRDILQAKALLAVGANPNTKDNNSVSALGHAIQSGMLESVELLLRHGADPDLHTGLCTPLSLAIYEEQWAMAHLILSSGANVNGIGSIRSTPLHIVVSHTSNIQLAESLVRNGADLQARDALGLVPLDLARRKRKKKMIELLERIQKSARKPKTARKAPR